MISLGFSLLIHMIKILTLACEDLVILDLKSIKSLGLNEEAEKSLGQ